MKLIKPLLTFFTFSFALIPSTSFGYGSAQLRTSPYIPVAKKLDPNFKNLNFRMPTLSKEEEIQRDKDLAEGKVFYHEESLPPQKGDQTGNVFPEFWIQRVIKIRPSQAVGYLFDFENKAIDMPEIFKLSQRRKDKFYDTAEPNVELKVYLWEPKESDSSFIRTMKAAARDHYTVKYRLERAELKNTEGGFAGAAYALTREMPVDGSHTMHLNIGGSSFYPWDKDHTLFTYHTLVWPKLHQVAKKHFNSIKERAREIVDAEADFILAQSREQIALRQERVRKALKLKALDDEPRSSEEGEVEEKEHKEL